MSRILLGLPTNGDVKMGTVCSLMMATNLIRALGHDLVFTVRAGPYTHWNREHLAQDAVKEEADYLMFVDTDVVFPAEGIATLLSRQKDVIGGMYNLKQDEPVTTIKLWKDDSDDADDGLRFKAVKDEPLPTEPFEVAALPTGFILIDVAVLRALPFPYFPCEFGIGEDVAFCLKVHDAGFEVWCDPTISIQHVGDKFY